MHAAYHDALFSAAGSPTLERVRRQLLDASELYRYWSATLPARTVRRNAADEHREICDAALARDIERAVDLLSAHLNATARQLEAVVVSAEPDE